MSSDVRIDKSQQLHRSQIACAIADGHLLVVYKTHVLRVNDFIASHPGGDKVMLQLVGMDGTDAISVYHPPSILNTILPRFSVGQLAEEDRIWRGVYPPVWLGWRRDQFEGHVDLASQLGITHFADDMAALRKAKLEEEKPTYQLPKSNMLPPIPIPYHLLIPQDIQDGQPLCARSEHAISQSFQQLHERVEPLYQLKSDAYLTDFARIFLVGCLARWLYTHRWYLCTAICIGCIWHQVTLMVHDCGHAEITGKFRKRDRWIGAFCASAVGGMSISWWVDNHNIHHIIPNDIHHDPDIQHIPFFAISDTFMRQSGVWSTFYHRLNVAGSISRALVKVQDKTYYAIMSVARVNLYALSYIHLFNRGWSKIRRDRFHQFELAGILVYWLWFGGTIYNMRDCGAWRRVGFFLLAHMSASPVHVQIVLSHFACSTNEAVITESFVRRQLRVTQDVTCLPWLDWIHGGLNMQVVHHCFPRIPRHNLREATAELRKWLKDIHEREGKAAQGMDYHTFGFAEANGMVLDVLKGVADRIQ